MPELSATPHDNHDDENHSLNDSNNANPEKPRLWALTYVCLVAVQAVIISGFVLGFTSPVLSRLKDIHGGHKSLHKTKYQDAFNVCTLSHNKTNRLLPCNNIVCV